jgi:hypothetical protein
MLFFKK